MDIHIVAYTPGEEDRWNAFVRGSKNGTFLFERPYMEYHSERFEDASLMVYDDRGRIVALLPAHLSDGELRTHFGLTYGGFVTDATMNTPLMLTIFRELLKYLHGRNITKVRYKTIPHIYHSMPAEEDLYCLFRADATLYRRDVLSVLDYGEVARPQERRLRNVTKARRQGLEVRETLDYALFWPILSENLHVRYGVSPVHTLEEIQLLSGRFPDAIRLFGAFRGSDMEAGVVIYLTRQTCHVQYPGTSDKGRSSGALDLLQQTLIDRFAHQKRYFDFGTSTEDDGRRLNEGLIAFKEGFGARAVMHDTYRLDVLEALEKLAGD